MRRKNDNRKEPLEPGSLLVVVKTVMNQHEEKNAQRNPGEKGQACCYCGKEGHLKGSCSQASKLPAVPCQVCKGPQWRRDCPQRCRALSTIRTEGVRGSP